MSNVPLLVSVADAARMLGVSPGTVRTLVLRGQLTCVRVGRRCLVRTVDVHALAGRTVGMVPSADGQSANSGGDVSSGKGTEKSKEWIANVLAGGVECIMEDGSVLTDLCDSYEELRRERNTFRTVIDRNVDAFCALHVLSNELALPAGTPRQQVLGALIRALVDGNADEIVRITKEVIG